MKKLLLTLALLGALNLFAQNKHPNLGEFPTKETLDSTDINTVKSPVQKYEEGLNKAQEGNPVYLFLAQTIDLFFANKVGTAFGSSTNLSLQKYYAVLDVSDKSFSLGYNFDNRLGNPLKQLNLVFSGGFKFRSDNNFSTLFEGNDFQPQNVEAMFSITCVRNGMLNYNNKTKNGNTIKDRRGAIEANRALIYDQVDKAVVKYNKEEFPAYVKKHKKLANYDKELTPLNKEVSKKQAELYKRIMEKELEYIQANQMYKYLFDHWYTLDVSLPFANSTYDVVPVINEKATERIMYAARVGLSANMMVEWSSGVSFFANAKYQANGTNNILIDQLQKGSFQTAILNPDNSITVNPPVEAYNTDYDYFINQAIKLEVAFFFLNNTVGISPAIEQNFGAAYDALNWKLGIPVSLKDKEGKPTVNFEIQWKEVSTLSETNRFVGVSTSFLFGKLIR